MKLEELALKANTAQFNKLKLLEEMHECGELIVKSMTKPKEMQDESHLIEELGDLILRASIVAHMVNIDKVNERIKYKTDLLYKHYLKKLDNKK